MSFYVGISSWWEFVFFRCGIVPLGKQCICYFIKLCDNAKNGVDYSNSLKSRYQQKSSLVFGNQPFENHLPTHIVKSASDYIYFLFQKKIVSKNAQNIKKTHTYTNKRKNKLS